MNEDIKTLKHWTECSNNIVFFGGAGVSTESGIPDFRSVDGLYSMEYDYPPEFILSHSFFMENPEEFYRFYRNKIICHSAEPNQAHLALARLEEAKKLKAVITQNIDGLHQRAGSKNVIELHGSVNRNYCMECMKKYSIEALKGSNVPLCDCGGIIRPDIVLYEEPLNNDSLIRAAEYVSKADMLIIGGTSLSVYPAAGLVYFYEGDRLVLINNSETNFDERVNLLIRENIGEVLGAVKHNRGEGL